MDLGEWVWAEVLTAAVAWLTVVCLLLARVPKPPSLLDSSLDTGELDTGELDTGEPNAGELNDSAPPAGAAPHGGLGRFLPKPRPVRHPKAKRLGAKQ